MMDFLLKLWNKFVPGTLIQLHRFLFEPDHYKIRRKAVLNYYASKNNTLPSEIKEGIKFLKFHKFTPYPYKWTLKYDNLLPEVLFDKNLGHFYVLFEGKKLYYPKHFTSMQAVWATRSSLKEQDPQSPHRYLTTDFQVEPGSIVVDAGVAEGNFALSVIDKVKKLYLIECDPEWMDTLRITFAPWKEKVIFVEKFLSDTDDATSTTIDNLLKPDEDEKYFIKMDIEGFEKKALAGMKNLLTSGSKVKMSVCTYHHPNDVHEIAGILKGNQFKYQVSDGYMLYFHSGEEPAFRKALIRAEK